MNIPATNNTSNNHRVSLTMVRSILQAARTRTSFPKLNIRLIHHAGVLLPTVAASRSIVKIRRGLLQREPLVISSLTPPVDYMCVFSVPNDSFIEWREYVTSVVKYVLLTFPVVIQRQQHRAQNGFQLSLDFYWHSRPMLTVSAWNPEVNQKLTVMYVNFQNHQGFRESERNFISSHVHPAVSALILQYLEYLPVVDGVPASTTVGNLFLAIGRMIHSKTISVSDGLQKMALEPFQGLLQLVPDRYLSRNIVHHVLRSFRSSSRLMIPEAQLLAAGLQTLEELVISPLDDLIPSVFPESSDLADERLFIFRVFKEFSTMKRRDRLKYICLMADATFNVCRYSNVLLSSFWVSASDRSIVPVAFLFHNDNRARTLYPVYRFLFQLFARLKFVIIDKDRSTISALNHVKRTVSGRLGVQIFICRAHNHRNIDRSVRYPHQVKSLLKSILFVSSPERFASIRDRLRDAASSHPLPDDASMVPFYAPERYIEFSSSSSDSDSSFSSSYSESDTDSDADAPMARDQDLNLWHYIEHHWLNNMFAISPAQCPGIPYLTTCALEGHHRDMKHKLSQLCGHFSLVGDSIVPTSRPLSLLRISRVVPSLCQILYNKIEFHLYARPEPSRLNAASVSFSQFESFVYSFVQGSASTLVLDEIDSIVVNFNSQFAFSVTYSIQGQGQHCVFWLKHHRFNLLRSCSCTCDDSNFGNTCNHILFSHVLFNQIDRERVSLEHWFLKSSFSQCRRLVFDVTRNTFLFP